jgi:hypothetical protein
MNTKIQTSQTLNLSKPPIRAKSPFLYYFDAQRNAVKDKYPKMAMKEIMAALRPIWESLDSQQKNAYISQSEDDKNRFKVERELYQAALRLQASKPKKTLKTQRSKKDTIAEESEIIDVEDNLSDLDSEDSRSDSYELQYFWAEDEEEEEEENKKDKKKKGSKKSAETAKTKAKQIKKEKDPESPKRSSTAFLFFCDANKEEYLNKFPKATPQELVVDLAELWKNLDENTKKPFVEKADSDKQRYLKEKEGYEAKKKFNGKSSKRKSEVSVDNAYITAIKEDLVKPNNTSNIKIDLSKINTSETETITISDNATQDVVVGEAQGEAKPTEAEQQLSEALQTCVENLSDALNKKAEGEKKVKTERNYHNHMVGVALVLVALMIYIKLQ